MEQNFNESGPEPSLRPTFLTVLCILTFIGSGASIISGIFSYTTASKQAKIFSSILGRQQNDSTSLYDSTIQSANQRKRKMFGEKMVSSVSKVMTAENIRKTSIGAITSAVLTLLGALLMWKGRRTGFYLYSLGVITGFIVPVYLYGNNLMAVGMSIFSSFFGLVFIALYALNFKYFRR